MKTPTLAALLFMCVRSVSAQKIDVKIVDRQDHDNDYSYVVPGHVYATSDTNVNCNGSGSTVNCYGSGTTSGVVTPAHEVPFHVRGATLTLQLSDGYAAVVNCESKFRERMAGPVRQPPELPHPLG
jgi:hypothetical protein